MAADSGKYPYTSLNTKKYLPKYPGESPTSGSMTSVRMYTAATSPTVSNDGFDSAGISQVFAPGDLWYDSTVDIMFRCESAGQGTALWAGLQSTSVTTITTTSHTAAAFSVIKVDDDTAGSTVTITLPDASDSKNRMYTVKKLGTTAQVNVAADSVEGTTSIPMLLQNMAHTFVSDGTTWSII